MSTFYRAGQYAKTGGPEVVQVTRRERRPPGRDEVLIEIEASSVSASDVMVRKGVVPADLRKYVPGYDLVGRVVEIGSLVDPAWRGKRVLGFVVWGGNAEVAYAAPHQLISVPDTLDPVAAAASGLNYATALGLLSIAPSGAVFFPGLTGGVGSAMLDLSRRFPSLALAGSVSPGTEPTAERFGATVWAYDDPDLAAKAARAFPAGFDVVFDPFGGARRNDLASLLKPSGTLVGMGFGGKTLIGYQANVLAYAIGGRRRRFFSIRALARRSPSAFTSLLRDLEKLISEGGLNPLIAGVYGLEELSAAHAHFDRKGASGKLVIRMKN